MSEVLIVDDEAGIRKLLTGIVARDGHHCTALATAGEALSAIKTGEYDIAIIDLGLPDRDGLELISAIRAISAIPIVVLSARDATEDKIAALDLGADDYVTKPFDGDEVLARLRSALRRVGMKSAGGGRVLHGPFLIDPARHIATLNGAPLSLTPKEFALLHALTEAGGRVLTHAQILRRIWGPAHESDVEYLRVAIRSLRQKVEAEPSRPRLIRNEPGIGYRLDC